MICLFGHHFDNFTVCFAHAHTPESAEIGNRVFHALCHQSVAAVELLPAAEHFKAENARLDRHRNFRRAGGLCPVADDAGRDRQCIDNRVGDFPAAAAVEIRNARACARSGL